MFHRRSTLVLVAVAAAFLVQVVSTDAYARTADLEVGIGAVLPIEDKAPIDAGPNYVLSTAIELSKSIDLELGGAMGRVRDSSTKNLEDVYQVTGGFRINASGEPGDTTRFFISLGGGYFNNFPPGDDGAVLYAGPGFRVQAGEHSGIVLRLSVVRRASSGADTTLLLPALQWFHTWD